MDEAKHENPVEHKHKKKFLSIKHIRENPWIISTAVLGLLIVIVLIFGGSGTGKVVSEKTASDNLVSFLNEQTGGGVEYVSSEKDGMLYKVTVSYQSQNIPVYVTKDGKYYVQGVSALKAETESNSNTNTQTETNVPKSDKPLVQLFIWGYCPYGVQAQGPLAEVADLLGNYADFKAVMYYDGHGEYETQQNKIQECIQEVAPEKYWDYAAGFVETIYPKCSSTRTVECDKTESIKLMNSVGIDSNQVMGCVSTKGESLISDALNYAKENGVSGSPTLMINGVKVNVARNAEAFKSAVCEAFSDAPEECATVLNSDAGAASGNC